jgi:hypothetical protein
MNNEMIHLSAAFQLFKKALANESQELISREDSMFHLRQLETLLISRSEYSLLVLLYKVMLLLEPADEGRLGILIQIAYVYIELGYVSQAGLCLSTAKSYLGHNQFEKSYWNAAYSLYLTHMGNTSKSATIITSMVSPSKKQVSNNSSKHRNKRNQAYLAHQVAKGFSHAHLLIAQGLATEALQVTLMILPSAKRLRSTNAMFLFHVLDLIVKLFSWAGLWRDAELYAEKGIRLARECHNSLLMCKFTTLLGNISQRKGMIDHALELLTNRSHSEHEPNGCRIQFEAMENKENVLRLLRIAETLLNKAVLAHRASATPETQSSELERAKEEADASAERAKLLLRKLKEIQTINEMINDPMYTPRIRRILPPSDEGYLDRLRASNLMQCDIELAAFRTMMLQSRGSSREAEKLARSTLNSINLFGPLKPIYYLVVARVTLSLIEPHIARLRVVQDGLGSGLLLESSEHLNPVGSLTCGKKPHDEIDERVVSRLNFVEQILFEVFHDSLDISDPSSLLEVGQGLMYIHVAKSLLGMPSKLSPSDIMEATCHGVTIKRMERVLVPTTKVMLHESRTNSQPLSPNAVDKRRSTTPATPATKFFSGACASPSASDASRSTLRRTSVTPRRTLNQDSLDVNLLSLKLDPSSELADSALDLPSDWLICRMTVDISRQILTLIVQKRDTQFATLALPLKRSFAREGGEKQRAYTFENMEKDMNTIIQTNNNMLKKSYETRDEKLQWWEDRTKLDRDLYNLLCKLESIWLGPFRGLLNGATHPFCNKFSKEVIEFLVSSSLEADGMLRKPQLPSFIASSWLSLGSTLMNSDLEDMAFYLLQECQNCNMKFSFDSGGGSKFHVVRSISGFLRKLIKKYTEMGTECPSFAPSQIILILDKHLSLIPWESITSLRGRPVSRVFSLEMLNTLWRTYRGISASASSLYYVLNPSGDLRNTQAAFEPILRYAFPLLELFSAVLTIPIPCRMNVEAPSYGEEL